VQVGVWPVQVNPQPEYEKANTMYEGLIFKPKKVVAANNKNGNTVEYEPWAWVSQWMIDGRKFPLDMASFAFPASMLLDGTKGDVGWSECWSFGFMESIFLEVIAGSWKGLQPLANGGTDINVFHNGADYASDKRIPTNCVPLVEDIWATYEARCNYFKTSDGMASFPRLKKGVPASCLAVQTDDLCEDGPRDAVYPVHIDQMRS
jgi:hypothetical protein